MEKLLVSHDGDHHPFLTEQGESPESTPFTLTVRIHPTQTEQGPQEVHVRKMCVVSDAYHGTYFSETE
jgi:hypothetical protein